MLRIAAEQLIVVTRELLKFRSELVESPPEAA
jgi:hypothetical protein